MQMIAYETVLCGFGSEIDMMKFVLRLLLSCLELEKDSLEVPAGSMQMIAYETVLCGGS